MGFAHDVRICYKIYMKETRIVGIKLKRIIRNVVISVLLLVFLALIINKILYQNTSYKRPKNKYMKKVESYVSPIDADGDGTDDQTDILEGALYYISSSPKYKSEYYATGYSNNEYGVCTDVVAHACLNAGYDLMELIQTDITSNANDYDIEKADPNIDFRRVKNLKIYFSHTAKTLTTDIYDIKEWQGGDIVVFENHIGIVSDRRNRKGVSYVIHHSGPYQRYYEEDILERRNDIVAHFRIS